MKQRTATAAERRQLAHSSLDGLLSLEGQHKSGVSLAGCVKGMADFEDRYECLERIGKGSFGEVFRGRHVQTGEIVAIKVIDLEQAEDEIEDIQQEISVMAQCDSPYVTRYHASYVVGTRLYLVMEYVGGGSVLVRTGAHNIVS